MAYCVAGLAGIDGLDHATVHQLTERQKPGEDLRRFVVVGLDTAHKLWVACRESADQRLQRIFGRKEGESEKAGVKSYDV